MKMPQFFRHLWRSSRPHSSVNQRNKARLRLEALEDRIVPALTFQFDYSRDTNGFFAGNPQARAMLEQAGADLLSRLGDTLSAVVPTPQSAQPDTWDINSFEPSNPSLTFTIQNPTIQANTILVFAGGETSHGGELGIGGPGGFDDQGFDQAWFDTVQGRGQTGALAASPTDFGPWGGSVSFDMGFGSWFFGSDQSTIGANQVDFYSVAQHELGHLIGFGTADSWKNLVSGSTFVGGNAMNEFGGPVPTDAAGLAAGHWADNTLDRGQHATMDPVAASGARTGFTPLDYAGLSDMGWQLLSPTPTMLAPTGTVTTGTPTFSWTAVPGATHYTLQVDDLTTSQTQVIFQQNITGTSFTPSSALPNGVYQVKVEGFNTGNSTSGFSSPLQFTVKILQNATLPFNDNFSTTFDGGLSPFWSNSVGAFNVQSNQATGVNSVNVATLNGLINATDVSESVTVTNLATGKFAALVARSQATGTNNLYQAGVRNNGGNGFTAEIWKNVGGTFTNLSTVTLSGFTGTGTIRFDAIGNSLRLFVNGTLATAAGDNTFLSGTLGLRSFDTVQFSNFMASATPAPVTFPFTDTFSTDPTGPLSATNWFSQIGSITIQSGAAVATAGGANVVVLNADPIRNVSVSATLNASTLPSGVLAALVTRYQGGGSNNLYQAGVRNNGASGYTAEIWRNVAGTFTLLSSAALSGFTGTNTIQFDAFGNSLRLSINGVLTTFANDDTFTSGTVGIRLLQGAQLTSFTAMAPAQATLPFTDTFATDTGPLLSSKWSNDTGYVSIQGNAVGVISGVNIAIARTGSVSDVSVSASVAALPTGALAALVARYQGTLAANFYQAGVRNNGASGFTAEIWKNVGGTFTNLGTVTLTGFSGTGTLRFDAVGNSLRLFINGTTVAVVTDNTFANGQSGVRIFQGVQLSSFTVAAATTVSVPLSDNFANDSPGALSSSWFTQAGSVSVQSSQAVGTAAGANLAVLNADPLGNVSVTVAAAPISAGGFAALVARYQGSGDRNMYQAGIRNNGTTYTAEIYRNLNGTWTLLSQVQVPGYMGANTLRFDVTGSSLQFFVNGSLMTSATDSTFASGVAGIRLLQGTAVTSFAIN